MHSRLICSFRYTLTVAAAEELRFIPITEKFLNKRSWYVKIWRSWVYKQRYKKRFKFVCHSQSNARSMLIEVCFVDTKSDADLYNEVGADRIAEAISDAIVGEKWRRNLQCRNMKN